MWSVKYAECVRHPSMSKSHREQTGLPCLCRHSITYRWRCVERVTREVVYLKYVSPPWWSYPFCLIFAGIFDLYWHECCRAPTILPTSSTLLLFPVPELKLVLKCRKEILWHEHDSRTAAGSMCWVPDGGH